MELAGFHDLRRLNATTLVVGGVDVKAAQVRLGHSDPRMTRNKPNGTAQKGSFIRSNPEDRANIAPKIDGYRVKSPAATLSPGTFVVGLPGDLCVPNAAGPNFVDPGDWAICVKEPVRSAFLTLLRRPFGTVKYRCLPSFRAISAPSRSAAK